MTGPREPKQGAGRWMVALFALPILCRAGPALLAALGAGSVGVLLGGATGSGALAIAGLAVAGVGSAAPSITVDFSTPNMLAHTVLLRTPFFARGDGP